MRITGGQLRGRVLRPPANLPIRPTTDFAKSALFNILSNYFDYSEINVLDLFTGAGSITFEFASRGTTSITSVDESLPCIQFIKKTASAFNIPGINCIRADAFNYIHQATGKFDVIFADPPFLMSETDHLPDLILNNNLLVPGGWLIVEHQAKRELKSEAKPFDVRKYGNCGFSFYKLNEE